MIKNADLYFFSPTGGTRKAAELLAKPNVDGGLIGGASLVAQKFTAIVDAAQ